MSVPITPGAYLKARRCAAGLSVADVAAAVTTVPRIAQHLRADWVERIEADVVPASFGTIITLVQIFPFDFQVLGALDLLRFGASVPAPVLCRICAGGKEWTDVRQTPLVFVEADLCSDCAGTPGREAAQC